MAQHIDVSEVLRLIEQNKAGRSYASAIFRLVYGRLHEVTRPEDAPNIHVALGVDEASGGYAVWNNNPHNCGARATAVVHDGDVLMLQCVLDELLKNHPFPDGDPQDEYPSESRDQKIAS